LTDIQILFCGVPVSDFERSSSWYAELFGRTADVLVNDDESMWRVTESAWLYVVRDEQRAGRSIVTLLVADLDLAVQGIRARGIEIGAVERVGDAGDKASATDPDGNLVSFIEVAGSER
jgi:predicted enzyme related to lactoylglutathione lyase